MWPNPCYGTGCWFTYDGSTIDDLDLVHPGRRDSGRLALADHGHAVLRLHESCTIEADTLSTLWIESRWQIATSVGGLYRGGSRYLSDATLTAGGMVIAGGADGMLRFWDASSGRLLWALQAHKSEVVGVHVEGSDIITRGFAGDISRWALPDPQQVIAAFAARADR